MNEYKCLTCGFKSNDMNDFVLHFYGVGYGNYLKCEKCMNKGEDVMKFEITIEGNIDNNIESLKRALDMCEKKKKEIEEKEKDWPQKGDEYYSLNPFGSNIVNKFKFDHIADHNANSRNLCFKTPEKAELFAKQCLLMRAMQARAEELNDGWVADWDDDEQIKFGVDFDEEIMISDGHEWNSFVYGVSVETKRKAEILLNEFGDQIKDLYGKKNDT